MPAPDPTLWTAARRILDLLDDLPPEADRVARAQEACLRDDGTLNDALYAEVYALLAAEEASEASGFLATDAAQASAHLLAERGVETAGRRVGPWEIAGLLGEGGMGAVYRAHRADGAYAQEVALKVIGRGLAPPSLLERFRRERQIQAGLSHPHIARLLDGGLSEEGQPYFAMELVKGEPITAYATRHDLGTEARLRLMQQVCDAVAYAHRRLIVHRDLKPSNVLVTEGDDGATRAVLLDFGIAKLLDDDDPGAARTAALLTPDYAAPEQFEGGEITTAADVYALGLLLYEILSGRRPYEGAGASPTERLRAMAVPPPPPSTLAGRRPNDLDAVVLKALAPEPERRYASADALRDDLDRVLAALPVTARRPTTAYRMGAFVRRHPLGVAAATAFVAVLVGFSALTAVQARRLAAERDRAEAEAESANQMQDYLVGLFLAVDPDQAQGRERTARELLTEGAARIETDLADQPLIQAELYRRVGGVFQSLGYFVEAIEADQRALALYRAAHGDAHPDVLQMLALLGGVYFDAGEPGRADSVLTLGLALIPETFDGPAVVSAGLYRTLGMVQSSVGAPEEAEALFRRAIADLDALPETDSTLLSHALAGLALSLHTRGEVAAADSLFRRRLAISRSLHGEDHTETARAYHYVGLSARSDGRLDDSVEAYARALAIRKRLLGDDHPDTAQTLQNLAVATRKLGRYAEAERLYRDALATLTDQLGPTHYQVAIVHNNLASLLIDDGRPQEAMPHAERALRDLRAHYGLAHTSVGSIHATRGKAHLGMGRLDAAEADFQAGLHILRAASEDATPREAPLLDGLGRTLHAQGRLEEAEAALRQSLALLTDAHAPPDVRIAEVRVNLGLVLADRGALSEARRLLGLARPVVEGAYADASIPPRRAVRELRARLRDA